MRGSRSTTNQLSRASSGEGRSPTGTPPHSGELDEEPPHHPRPPAVAATATAGRLMTAPAHAAPPKVTIRPAQLERGADPRDALHPQRRRSSTATVGSTVPGTATRSLLGRSGRRRLRRGRRWSGGRGRPRGSTPRSAADRGARHRCPRRSTCPTTAASSPVTGAPRARRTRIERRHRLDRRPGRQPALRAVPAGARRPGRPAVVGGPRRRLPVEPADQPAHARRHRASATPPTSAPTGSRRSTSDPYDGGCSQVIDPDLAARAAVGLVPRGRAASSRPTASAS